MKKISTMLLALTLLNLNYSCSDDESVLQISQSNQTDALLKTVSLDQINDFNQNSSNFKSARLNRTAQEAQIFYDALSNSDEYMAVELLEFTDNKLVRDIYFEYEGEIRGFKVYMKYDQFNNPLQEMFL